MANKGPKQGGNADEQSEELEGQPQGLFAISARLSQSTKQLERARNEFDDEVARLSGIELDTPTGLEGETDQEENLFETSPLELKAQDDEGAQLTTEDQDEEVDEEQEEELDVSDAAVDLVSSTKNLFAQLGKVSPSELEANVEKRLGQDMTQRIKSLPAPQMLMGDDGYAVYAKNFMNNPFEALGKSLKENKDNPEKAFSLLDFMVRGAQRTALELSQEQNARKESGEPLLETDNAALVDVKAKLLALEEVQSVLNSLIALEKNNCRYSKTEYAKKIAQVQAMISKTNVDPDAQMIFARQMRDVLENFKYSERRTVGSAIAQTADSLLRDKYKFNPKAEYTPSRGRNEFDTRKDSLGFGKDVTRKAHIKERLLHPETIAKLNTIKVGHSDQGKVVHLSFSFDRTKILKGDSKEFAKMEKQVKDALTISIAEYGKGSMDNPISVSYRPPELKQPELAFAMLKSLKEKAMEEGKSFYVKDPNDPEKTIEFTAKPEVNEHEMACLNHYAREIGTGARCDVAELISKEKNPTDEEFKDYLENIFKAKADYHKDNTDKKDNEIVKEYDKSKKMRN